MGLGRHWTFLIWCNYNTNKKITGEVNSDTNRLRNCENVYLSILQDTNTFSKKRYCRLENTNRQQYLTYKHKGVIIIQLQDYGSNYHKFPHW